MCPSRAFLHRTTLQKAGHRWEQQEQKVSHLLISGRSGRLKAVWGMNSHLQLGCRVWGRSESSYFQRLVEFWRLAQTSSLPRGRSLRCGELLDLSLAVFLLFFHQALGTFCLCSPRAFKFIVYQLALLNVGMQMRWELGPIREELSKLSVYPCCYGDLCRPLLAPPPNTLPQAPLFHPIPITLGLWLSKAKVFVFVFTAVVLGSFVAPLPSGF